MQRMLMLGGVMLAAGLVAGALAGAVVGYRVGHAPVPQVTRDRDQLRIALNEAQAQIATARNSLGSTETERAGLRSQVMELEGQVSRLRIDLLNAKAVRNSNSDTVAAVVDSRSGGTRRADRRNALTIRTIGGDGKFVQLSDGTIYEVWPASCDEARSWDVGSEVRVTENASDVPPIRIVNAARGAILHAERAAAK